MPVETQSKEQGMNRVLGVVRDLENAFVVGGGAGAFIGIVTGKLLNLFIEFDNAEFSGGAMEIPVEVPAVVFALAGVAYVGFKSLSESDNSI